MPVNGAETGTDGNGANDEKNPTLSLQHRERQGWGNPARELRLLMAHSKETLKAALSNAQTSPEHKAELRKHLEELEKLLVQRDIESIKALVQNSPAATQLAK